MPAAARNTRHPLALAVLVALAAQPHGYAFAAGTRTLEEVQVTATRRAESTIDVAVATTVVGRDEIRRGAPQTAMDALHGKTGTFVQQTTPGQAVVIVRGLKGSEVLHLVDGFRLNNAIFRNAPNQYMALVDGQMLDGIEVVRGPMSTLYGGDAMGGVVQLLSWDPRFDGPDWGVEGRARAAYSTADDAWLTRTEAAVGRDGLALSAGLTYQDVETLRAGGGRELAFTDFIARGGNAKLVAQPSEQHELMVQVQYFVQPKTPRHDELVPGFGQTRATSSVFLFEPQARRLAHARWRWSPGLTLLDAVEVHAGRQFIRDDRRTRDNGAVVEDAERNSVTSDGITLTAESSFHERHYLTWGMELYDDAVRSTRVRRDIRNGALTARPARFPDGSTMRQFGVFAIDDWRITDRVDLLWGLRWTDVETVLPPVINGIGARVEDDALSGNIGVNWALRDEVRLVANLGRGFRAPNVFDLGTFGDRPGNRFNEPNPDLAPERITTFDLGVKLGGDTLSGELIGFRSRFEDKISSVLTGAVLPNGRLVTQSRNITEQVLYGVEAGLEWLPDNRWRTYASATWTRGDEETLGVVDPADRIPPLFGKLGASWAYSDTIEFEGWLMYATSQDRLSPRDLVDPRINPTGTAGWTTINARVGWTPTENWALALRLENLGDRRYREHGSGLDEPGRNITGIVEYRF